MIHCSGDDLSLLLAGTAQISLHSSARQQGRGAMIHCSGDDLSLLLADSCFSIVCLWTSSSTSWRPFPPSAIPTASFGQGARLEVAAGTLTTSFSVTIANVAGDPTWLGDFVISPIWVTWLSS